MGMRWTQGDVRIWGNRLGDLQSTVYDHIVDSELKDSGEYLKELGQHIIDTTGTNNEWDPPWPARGGSDRGTTGGRRSGSGEGRVETGQMRDDFTYEIGGGGKVHRLRVGWINRFLDYYRYQNEGFTHWITNVFIPGMDLTQQLKNETKQEVSRAGDRIVSRMGQYLATGRITR